MDSRAIDLRPLFTEPSVPSKRRRRLPRFQLALRFGSVCVLCMAGRRCFGLIVYRRSKRLLRLAFGDLG